MVRETELILSAKEGDAIALARLLESRKGKGSDAGELDIALVAACCNGHARILRCLVEAGANLEFTDDTDFTPLLWAVEHSRFECVKELVSLGSDPNARSYSKGTPLILACELRNPERDLNIVKILLDAKADPDLQDGQQATAVMWSIVQGSLDLLRLLIDAKANLDLVDGDGQTALILAVQSSSRDRCSMVNALVNAGADVNKQDREGNTALMLAVDRSDRDMVETLLIVGGTDVHKTNVDGETAFDIAKEKVEGGDGEHAQEIYDTLRVHIERHPPPAKKVRA